MELKPMNEIINIVTDFVANGSFKSLNQNVTYVNKPDYARLIRLVDYNNNFSEHNAVYVTKSSYDFLQKSKLTGGEIIISNVGANLGTVFKCPKLNIPMTLGPNAIMVKSKINDHYLYYYFCSESGQKNILSLVSGSAMPKFNKTDFKNLTIPVVDEQTQQHIVNTIGTIDDLIELKLKLIKKNEEYSHILYNKILNDSKNKTLVNLSDYATFINGYSYKGEELVENSNIGMVTIKNFDRVGGFKVEGIKPVSPQKKNYHVLNKFDLLVAHTDLTQNAEIVGNPIILMTNNDYEKYIYSMDLVQVLPTKNLSSFYLYQVLKDITFKKHALGYTHGTTVLHLNKEALNKFKFYIPDKDNIYLLNSKLDSIYNQIANLYTELDILNNLKESYLNKFFK